MTDPLTEKFTNNTLEEELRTMLVDKNNECNALKAEIETLRRSVAEEQEAKYRAYIKFADLQHELKALQDSTK
jgi:chromosome segregation ATPase